jgi:hypothetical protein
VREGNDDEKEELKLLFLLLLKSLFLLNLLL